jgi:thymidine kinase
MSQHRASITGFLGPMNAKKTLMLLDLIKSAEAVNEKVLVYKPASDDRFAVDKIASRCGGTHEAIPVPPSKQGDMKAKSSFILTDVVKRKEKIDLIAVDEVEMFDDDIAEVVYRLSGMGIQVAYSGLNMNYRGEPFTEGIKNLMPISTKLEILVARCTYKNNKGKVCGDSATMTQRLKNGKPDSYKSPLIIIEKFAERGEKLVYTYEARCSKHWSISGSRPKGKLKYK